MKTLFKIIPTTVVIIIFLTSNFAISASSKHIVLFGAPGAGTNAQVKILSEKYGLKYININLLIESKLRKLYKSISPDMSDVSINEVSIETIGRALKQANNNRYDKIKHALSLLKKGQLVDDAVIDVMVAQTILQEDHSKGFIINGYPMNERQASFLDALFDTIEGFHYSRVKVIYLNTTDEVVLKRMKKRKRIDDQLGFAKARLKYFRDNMNSILEYYNDDIIEIDGTLPVTEITKKIEQSLQL